MFNKNVWLVDVTFSENSECEDYTIVCRCKEEADNIMKWASEGIQAKTDKGEFKPGFMNVGNRRECSKFKFIMDHLFGKAKFVKLK